MGGSRRGKREEQEKEDIGLSFQNRKTSCGSQMGRCLRSLFGFSLVQ